MKFIKEWKTILEYRTPMHKWKIPTRLIILKYLHGYMSPKQFAVKYKINQPLVAQTMYNLHNQGFLSRIICDCGKGFLYRPEK